MNYGLAFFVAAALSFSITWVVRLLAIRCGVVDRSEDAPERKIHVRPVPLLGGLAIFASFFLLLAYLSHTPGAVTGVHILPKYLWGMFIGATVLMVGGYFDDRYKLSPGLQIISPLIATVVVIVSGIGIRFIANPFGGVLHLDSVNIPILTFHGIAYHLTLWADLFTFLWLLGMMYTTKFLDGLDGLVAGITTLGSLTVFLLSIRPPVLQSETAMLSVVLAGACAGFLLWNWHPARVFLGEGGSLLTGFLLGILAIVAGSKIATALLIMGIPILDVVWVIVRRLCIDRTSPFRTADRKHLHFRLLDVGFSHRTAVLFLYSLVVIFSTTTLIFHGIQKVIALVVLATAMLVLGIILVVLDRRRRSQPFEGLK